MRLFVALAAWASLPALAQTPFELPRECRERQVANPDKCIIQDGPPHRVYPGARNNRLNTSSTAASNASGAGSALSPASPGNNATRSQGQARVAR